ncbi:hypothetical protein DPMN_141345 [Dreissena polymorpha]|uniref:Uncharacterized protein n=1 Tax=Dreissena polymorpha TaxID=45954 RepID=A0A9D4JMI7_DREPO|nr:hypothetical protein DPMN_141345 [Dreissena polymorpha]
MNQYSRKCIITFTVNLNKVTCPVSSYPDFVTNGHQDKGLQRRALVIAISREVK